MQAHGRLADSRVRGWQRRTHHDHDHRDRTGGLPDSRAEVHAGGRLATVDDWHVWAVDPASSPSR